MLKTSMILIGAAFIGVFAPRFTSAHLATAVVFAVAVAASRLLDITLPQGGKLHIDTAVIIAAIVLFPFTDVVVIIISGIIIAMLIKQVSLELGSAAYPLSLKIITAFIAACIYYLIGGRPGAVEPVYGLAALTLLCVVYSIVDLGFDQLTISIRRGTPYIPGLVSSVKFLGPIYLSLSSLGVLLATMFKGTGYWSLVLFFVPLLVTRLSFKSYLDIRKVYRKTIEALSNAIEAQNSRRSGHGRRVANYSVDIAKELGMHGRDLELIGYAALLHDIGMLGVDEDSLDQLLENVSVRSGEAPHATIGAEVVEQVDFLRDAADMVRKHHVPYDKVRRTDTVPMGARIINVASHFDRLTRADNPNDRLTSYQAISHIKSEQSIRFDPRVVRALVNLLRKQGKLMEFVS